MEYTQKEALLIFYRTLKLAKANGFSLSLPDPENPGKTYRQLAIEQLVEEGKIRDLT